MDIESLKYIAVGMIALGLYSSAAAIGNIFSTLISSIARNPEAEEKISKYVYVAAGLAESIGLFSLVIALLLIFK